MMRYSRGLNEEAGRLMRGRRTGPERPSSCSSTSIFDSRGSGSLCLLGSLKSGPRQHISSVTFGLLDAKSVLSRLIKSLK